VVGLVGGLVFVWVGERWVFVWVGWLVFAWVSKVGVGGPLLKKKKTAPYYNCSIVAFMY
jgi:hypothetical protein